MRLRTTRTAFLLGVLAAGLASACGSCGGSKGPPPAPPPRPTAAASSASTGVVFDVYLDASIPMAGFLRTADPDKAATGRNYFRALLDKGESLLGTGVDGAEFHYWRFDQGRPQPLKASLRDFITRPGQFNGKESQIEQPVRHSGADATGKGPRVKVIISDLFITGSSVGTLATALNEHLARPGGAVGVLAIRNLFHGEIADLLGTGEPGGLAPGAADSLPFYVLVTGPVSDVARVLDRLEHRLELPKGESFTLLYTRDLSASLVQPLALLRPPGSSGAAGFATKRMVPSADPGEFPQLLLSEGRVVNLRMEVPGTRPAASTGGVARVGQLLPGSAVAAVIPVVARPAPAMRLAVTAWKPRPGKSEWAYEPDAAAQKAFSADLASGILTVDTARLRDDTLYRLQLDMVAAPTPKPVPAMAAWSLEDAPRVLRNKAFDEHEGHRPGKTPNLEYFIQTLSDGLFSPDRPLPLARYYAYFRVN